jgi:hypothetical protein
MAIHYTMVKNTIAEGYYPRVVRNDHIDLEMMVRNIVSKTTLTEGTILSVIHALKEEAILGLANGNVVHVDNFVTFSVSLGGKTPFTSIQDTVTKDNVHLKVNVKDDVSIVNQVFEMMTLHKDTTVIKSPLVTIAFETTFNTEFYYVPNGIIRIRGDHLKFNKSHSDEGVFIIQPDGAETRLSSYSSAGEKIIDTVIPNLGNNLALVVRARYTDDGDLREGKLSGKLTMVRGFLFEGAIAVLASTGATGTATVRWNVAQESDDMTLTYYLNEDTGGTPVSITEKGQYTLQGADINNTLSVVVLKLNRFRTQNISEGSDSIALT